eukprot:scaffold65596_cov49-Phaeocystis_antarctica.AAC.1
MVRPRVGVSLTTTLLGLGPVARVAHRDLLWPPEHVLAARHVLQVVKGRWSGSGSGTGSGTGTGIRVRGQGQGQSRARARARAQAQAQVRVSSPAGSERS